MYRTRILITLVSAAVMGSGCASGGKTASTAASATATRGTAGASRYLVTEDELVNLGDRSAYEALQQLRPSFLHSRDTQTSRNPIPAPVDVFVDGTRAARDEREVVAQVRPIGRGRPVHAFGSLAGARFKRRRYHLA